MKKVRYALLIMFWCFAIFAVVGYFFIESAFKDFLYSITFLSSFKSWAGINELTILIAFSSIVVIMLVPTVIIAMRLVKERKK